MMCVNVSVESIWLVVECINATYQILSTSLPLSVCWILDTGTDLSQSLNYGLYLSSHPPSLSRFLYAELLKHCEGSEDSIFEPAEENKLRIKPDTTFHLYIRWAYGRCLFLAFWPFTPWLILFNLLSSLPFPSVPWNSTGPPTHLHTHIVLGVWEARVFFCIVKSCAGRLSVFGPRMSKQ